MSAGAGTKLLVTRFSAMGDVAMVVPALRAVLAARPDVEITLVTRELFLPFFQALPRVRVVVADFKGRHRGLRGLWRLYRELAPQGFDALIDLHNVTRSQILGALFRLSGVPVRRIDKGRGEKKAYIAGRSRRPLRHTVQRYLDSFARFGISAEEVPGPYLQATEAAKAEAERVLAQWGIDADTTLVGIAPFAMHAQKMWPLERTRQVLASLSGREGLRLLLFGGGEEESRQLEALAEDFPHTINLAGKLGLEVELALMPRLALMLSMDSSNMHLASLSGVPTFSIWGGTHPDLGFRAYGQPAERSLQTRLPLDCRPCSVYGAKHCRYAETKCLTSIEADTVTRALLAQLGD